MICTAPTICVLLACSLLIVQAQQQQTNPAPAVANNNMAAAVQNMINYFNEHPFKDASGRPSQAFQSMLQQMQSADSSNANTPTNSADVALPAIPPTVADVVLPAAPPVINDNAGVKNAPADIPIALAAGVPASVAAAAAVPHNQPVITTPQDNNVVVSGEPALKQSPPASPGVVPPAIVPEAPALVPQTPNVVPEAPAVVPQMPNVVPEAPPVVPQTPNVVPEAPPVVPQTPNIEPEALVPATEPSAIVAPVSNNPSFEPASIVPVSTIYASESSTVPPAQPSSTSSHAPTTGTTMMTRTNAMSTATSSASRSLASSASASRSASATSTIPPISASSTLRLGDGVLLSMGLGLIVVITTMISPLFAFLKIVNIYVVITSFAFPYHK